MNKTFIPKLLKIPQPQISYIKEIWEKLYIEKLDKEDSHIWNTIIDIICGDSKQYLVETSNAEFQLEMYMFMIDCKQNKNKIIRFQFTLEFMIGIFVNKEYYEAAANCKNMVECLNTICCME